MAALLACETMHEGMRPAFPNVGPAWQRRWRGRLVVRAASIALAAGGLLCCGEEGLFPTTVDPGSDFSVANAVFDEGFYYCSIEPMLFARSCGSGDPSQGDPQNGCHHNVTSYRLTAYMPPVADSCSGIVPGGPIPSAARQNYQSTQARMRRDPALAPLLMRPTGKAVHPRVIFDANSQEADLIRTWATRYSSQ